ncbi:YfhO family protein [Enterococcus sp. LJL99]
MSKKRTTFLRLMSFLLPFALLLTLWLILGLAPFGKNNLLVSDLGTQYLPFLSAFKQYFESGNHLTYSFSNGIGGSILSLVAYYVISPFNFLVFFFSSSQLPIAILLIITLKISCMGSAMFYYLQKTYQRTTSGLLLFSTSYSLCGFVIAYSLNFMWLDALILLPLLILSIQRLWEQKKWGAYSILLFLTIITNYYMGYMICIFAVCYSMYWYYLSPNKKTKSIWRFFKSGKLFFLSSFLSGVSTSFILLPAIEGMLQTKKTAFDLSTFFPKPVFGFSFLSQFGLGTINFDLRLDHLPSVFSGLLMTLLFITYFTLKEISFKEKKATLLVMGFIFLSFWLEGLGTVWHMFQNPAGFPYRNTFIFSFLLIKFAYEAYLKLKDGAILPLKVPLIFSVLLSIGQLALAINHQTFLLSNSYFFISLFFIWLFYFIIYVQQKTHYFKKSLSILLLALVCCEIGTNYWISLKDIPFGNQQNYATMYQQQSQIIRNLKAKQPELFRIKQTLDSTASGYSEKNNGYNNSILFGYAGVSSYTSTLEASTQDSLNILGLYAKNDRRIGYVDNSKVINFLLNVPYEITPETLDKEPLEAFEETTVYKNDEAIGMGILAADTLKDLELTTKDPLKNHEDILQQFSPSTEPYFENVKKLTEKTTANYYQLEAQVNTTGDLYAYIPHINWKNVSDIEVNGKKIKPTIAIATNQLFNLGFFNKNEPVTLTIYSKKKLDLTDWTLQTLNQNKFDQLVSEKQEQSLSLHKENGRYSGQITVDDDDRLLYLSIPFDKNWTVKVDGNKVATFPVLENFTGINLAKGTHQVTFQYHQKSFTLGIMISILVLFSVSFYQLIKWRLKKRTTSSNQ